MNEMQSNTAEVTAGRGTREWTPAAPGYRCRWPIQRFTTP